MDTSQRTTLKYVHRTRRKGWRTQHPDGSRSPIAPDRRGHQWDGGERGHPSTQPPTGRSATAAELGLDALLGAVTPRGRRKQR